MPEETPRPRSIAALPRVTPPWYKTAKYHVRAWRYRDRYARNGGVVARLQTVVREMGRHLVFYVVDSLEEVGGVERKLELQFAWLREHGIEPVLVTERDDYAAFKEIPHLFLYHDDPAAEEKLFAMVEALQPLAVEFNMKGAALFNRVDLARLKSLTRVGAMLHGETDVLLARLPALDFCLATTSGTRPIAAKAFPNVVQFPARPVAYNLAATRALYIGRIDRGKLPTLQTFVEICEKWQVPYQVAGSFSTQSDVVRFQRRLPLAALLGPIDTRAFLAEHGHDYLFVGGVGQVPLEAAAVNLPALITTHHVHDAMRSAVLTAENMPDFLAWNCVINKMPQGLVASNLDAFFEALQTAKATDSVTPLMPYRVRNELARRLDVDVVFGEYEAVLLGRVDR